MEEKDIGVTIDDQLEFESHISEKINKAKYQGVKEFYILARIGCCNFMIFSPFKVNVTYYHPLNQWLLGATNDNQGQTVMHYQCSETINHI